MGSAITIKVDSDLKPSWAVEVTATGILRMKKPWRQERAQFSRVLPSGRTMRHDIAPTGESTTMLCRVEAASFAALEVEDANWMNLQNMPCTLTITPQVGGGRAAEEIHEVRIENVAPGPVRKSSATKASREFTIEVKKDETVGLC